MLNNKIKLTRMFLLRNVNQQNTLFKLIELI
jgi:hypothetical protein